MQALEYGHKFYKEDKHCNELGIATLTSYFVNANKDPKKGSKVTPSDFFFFKPDNSKEINPNCAVTFFSLVTDGLMPDWAVPIAPIKEFAELKPKGTVASLGHRALIGVDTDILIICPELVGGDRLFAGFMFIWEVDTTKHPSLIVKNIDNDRKFKLITPEPEGQSRRITMVYSNYYFDLLPF